MKFGVVEVVCVYTRLGFRLGVAGGELATLLDHDDLVGKCREMLNFSTIILDSQWMCAGAYSCYLSQN